MGYKYIAFIFYFNNIQQLERRAITYKFISIDKDKWVNLPKKRKVEKQEKGK